MNCLFNFSLEQLQFRHLIEVQLNSPYFVFLSIYFRGLVLLTQVNHATPSTPKNEPQSRLLR